MLGGVRSGNSCTETTPPLMEGFPLRSVTPPTTVCNTTLAPSPPASPLTRIKDTRWLSNKVMVMSPPSLFSTIVPPTNEMNPNGAVTLFMKVKEAVLVRVRSNVSELTITAYPSSKCKIAELTKGTDVSSISCVNMFRVRTEGLCLTSTTKPGSTVVYNSVPSPANSVLVSK